MGLIVDNIYWILMVTGVLTAGVGLNALAPARGLNQAFGTATDNAAALLVTRHWFFLIGVTGALLIVAALHPEWRVPILWLAIASKSSFAALVLAGMGNWAGKPAVIGAVADIVMVALYLIYLVAV